MKSSFLILFVAVTLNVFSQFNFKSGEIYRENETIQGEIDLKTLKKSGQICVFKDVKNKITNYSPSDITGYKFENGRKYVSAKMDSMTVFLECLIEGKLSLFYYKDWRNEHFYVVKDEGNLIELVNTSSEIYDNYSQLLGIKKNKEYQTQLLNLTSDGIGLMQQLKQTEFYNDGLIKYIEAYNKQICPDEVCQVYKSNQINTFYLEPTFGYINSVLNFDFVDNYENKFKGRNINNSNSFILGSSIRIGNFFGLSEKLHFQLGLYYLQYRFNVEEQVMALVPVEIIEPGIDLKSNVVRLPISINYQLLTSKKWTPFVELGASYSLLLQNNMKDQFAKVIAEAYYSKYQINLLGSVGTYCKLTDKITSKISATYERGNGLSSNMAGWSSNIRSIITSFSLVYKLKNVNKD